MTMTEHICSVEGCMKPVLAKGWCGMHYGRWRKTGDPGGAAPQRQPLGAVKLICATDGCRAYARRNGLCASCSAKTRRDGAAYCTIPECGNRINARGLCGKHYSQVRNGLLDHPEAAEIRRTETCAIADCDKPAYARGWCNMHWQRHHSNGEPGEAAPRKRTYEPGQLCAIPTCGQAVRAGGYCGKHNRRFSKYGVTAAEVDDLLRRQRGCCAICQAPDPGQSSSGEWCIDHDHVTGQVRGLLCGPCNIGIGLLRDDPKVIKAALRYIERHRQMQLFGPEGPKKS